MTVSELLLASMKAHGDYREAQHVKNTIAARAALVEAERFRQQAHETDPQHEDPIWAQTEPTHPHDKLVTFYAEVLAR